LFSKEGRLFFLWFKEGTKWKLQGHRVRALRNRDIAEERGLGIRIIGGLGVLGIHRIPREPKIS